MVALVTLATMALGPNDIRTASVLVIPRIIQLNPDGLGKETFWRARRLFSGASGILPHG